MEENKEELEQNKHENPTSHIARVITIGFFGGVFWSIIGFIAYYFNFTAVGPALAINGLELGAWKNEPLGHVIGIIVIGVLSIGVAIIYNALLQKMDNIWVGILFGAVLWGIVFYLLNPIFPGLAPIAELGLNTIVTTVCLYVLYGVFIGYSVAYDASETRKHQVSYSNQ